LQALVTLNDPVYIEAAQALARRMSVGQPAELPARTVDSILVRGYRLALQQTPTAGALTSLRSLYVSAQAYYADHPSERAKAAGTKGASVSLAALSVVAGSILNLDGFITKE
jgi:hypothetical protein